MRLILMPLLLLPTLARADAGAHLHPHGSDALWLVLVAGIAAAGGYALARWRK